MNILITIMVIFDTLIIKEYFDPTNFFGGHPVPLLAIIFCSIALIMFIFADFITKGIKCF